MPSLLVKAPRLLLQQNRPEKRFKFGGLVDNVAIAPPNLGVPIIIRMTRSAQQAMLGFFSTHSVVSQIVLTRFR